MRLAVAALFVAMALCGCSRTKLTDWDKPGLSLAEFNTDTTECQREVNQNGSSALERTVITWWNEPYNRCMEARGYRRLF